MLGFTKEEAQAQFFKGKTLAANKNAEFLRRNAEAWLVTNNKNTDEAIVLINAAIKMEPKTFENYINNGLNQLNSFNFEKLKKYEKIYVYGCGQFLFKILDKIQDNCNIINIIDDNLCYSNKKINGVDIINYDMFKEICKDGDNILLTTMVHDVKIKEKLLLIDKNINMLEIIHL